MSPQMNGEPRDAAIAATEAPVSQPLPPVLNTEAIVKTTVRPENDLAPLFESSAATDFLGRWDRVQRSFVDDPREAVHAADELVAQVTKNLTETFANQRAELEKSFDNAQAPTTESLRIALRQYRAYFERLLSL